MKLSRSPELRYHVVRVSEGTSTLVFDSREQFLENARNLIRESSGQPVRLFMFLGWRVEYTTPQVTVGLRMPGRSRPDALILADAADNPDGDVPNLDLK